MRGGPHLDVRPVDAATGSIFLKMGVGFFAMGLVMAAVGILALQDLVGGMGRSEGYGFTAFGVLGAIGSIFLAGGPSRSFARWCGSRCTATTS